MRQMNGENVCKVEEEEDVSSVFPFTNTFLGWQQNHPMAMNSSMVHLTALHQQVEKKQKRENKFEKMTLKSEPTDAKIKKINQRRGRYKRSTNNSHKKFICVARKLLFKHLNISERDRFEEEYAEYKNSRAYFFIILAQVKIKLSEQRIEDFKKSFFLLMNNKVDFYKKEINKTDNKNFINFRYDEITDIKYAMKAFSLYFQDEVESSIEVIYKKQKSTVLKKQQFGSALKIVQDIEERLRRDEPQNRYQEHLPLNQSHSQIDSSQLEDKDDDEQEEKDSEEVHHNFQHLPQSKMAFTKVNQRQYQQPEDRQDQIHSNYQNHGQVHSNYQDHDQVHSNYQDHDQVHSDYQNHQPNQFYGNNNFKRYQGPNHQSFLPGIRPISRPLQSLIGSFKIYNELHYILGLHHEKTFLQNLNSFVNLPASFEDFPLHIDAILENKMQQSFISSRYSGDLINKNQLPSVQAGFKQKKTDDNDDEEENVADFLRKQRQIKELK